MLQKLDFLTEMEGQTCYLRGAVKGVEIIVDDLQRNLIASGKILNTPLLASCLDQCAAICALLRELRRIQEDLDAAVDSEFQEKKRLAAGPDGGK